MKKRKLHTGMTRIDPRFEPDHELYLFFRDEIVQLIRRNDKLGVLAAVGNEAANLALSALFPDKPTVYFSRLREDQGESIAGTVRDNAHHGVTGAWIVMGDRTHWFDLDMLTQIGC